MTQLPRHKDSLAVAGRFMYTHNADTTDDCLVSSRYLAPRPHDQLPDPCALTVKSPGGLPGTFAVTGQARQGPDWSASEPHEGSRVEVQRRRYGVLPSGPVWSASAELGAPYSLSSHLDKGIGTPLSSISTPCTFVDDSSWSYIWFWKRKENEGDER